MKHKEPITLGADIGGQNAFIKVHDQVLELRKLFKERCVGPYSSRISEFSIVLRIDGDVQEWKRSDVGNIFVNYKKSYITGDIFVPLDVWSTEDNSNFKKFIYVKFNELIDKFVMSIARDDESLLSEQLRSDVEGVGKAFLGT